MLSQSWNIQTRDTMWPKLLSRYVTYLTWDVIGCKSNRNKPCIRMFIMEWWINGKSHRCNSHRYIFVFFIVDMPEFPNWILAPNLASPSTWLSLTFVATIGPHQPFLAHTKQFTFFIAGMLNGYDISLNNTKYLIVNIQNVISEVFHIGCVLVRWYPSSIIEWTASIVVCVTVYYWYIGSPI